MKKITLLLALLTFSLGANAQAIFSEDFEGGAIPAGWTNENESVLGDATHVWTIDNTGEAYYFGVGNTYMYDEGLAGSYAIFNSDAYGGGQATASLTSPAFDCSAGGAIKLSFNAWFTSGYGATAKVEASADGGATWTVVEEYASSNDYGAKIFDITSIVGTSATAHVKFTYAGDYAYYYAVDNITVATDPLSNNKNAFENISLYPNPTTGIMTLSGVDMNSLSDIEITNQLGQQVMNITPSKLDANTLNIRNLNKGIYFVQVTNNMDMSKTFKVIKK